MLCAALVIALSGPAFSAEQVEFFEARIRPVLAQECYECHSAAVKRKGGLLLDSRAGWQAGGDSGAAIKPGDAKNSLLLQSLRHEHEDLKMPKAGAKLDDAVLADFEHWINSGAADPRDAPPTKEQVARETEWSAVLARRKQWWAFLPLAKVTAPSVDALLEAKMVSAGLSPSPAADGASVLRRLHYVLTGLPPSPQQQEQFAVAYAKQPASAIANTVDELLASERFGEAWARHFMDWVRFAESHGSEGDAPVPYAWRYRDYLIRAFNQNVPYPQMLREVIAGDLLAQPRIANGVNESALGIGQLRMVLHGFSPVDSLDEMVSFTDNQIDTVTKAFQALTVSCARCHNHKFDAISQADFYSLYGIFTSTHPAVIDANAADDKAQREELSRLKLQLREVVGAAWQAAFPPDSSVAEVATPPSTGREFTWFASGKGITSKPTQAGEFAVGTEGTQVISRIHPSGWFSGLQSTKDSAVLASPRFKSPGGTLWMRAAGSGESRARYIVQNYPRTGTIHKAKEFKAAEDAALGWRKLDLEFWKGDEIFIQCATAADLPAETKLDQPSWFGITEWRILGADEPEPPKPQRASHAGNAVKAWREGKATDAQAELLDTLLQDGKLPNDRRSIPGTEPLIARYRAVENRLPVPIRAPGVLEADATDRPLFVRGDHKQPAELVPRRFLDAIDPRPFQTKGSGRLELAESMADMQRNPLTARVIVNRLWHHIFGRGIVASTDNFGRLGELPAHPELLDFLAQRFIASGGDVKGMIKTLVTTAAFARSARAPAGAEERDPDNKLLSHWSVRRMEAEGIRDAMLQLSGKLESSLGGESVVGGDTRRSVYVKVIRNSLDAFLTAFDAPVPSSSRGRRDVTNVPAQSLALLNDKRVANWAKQWGLRTTGDDRQRVKQMYVEAFSRQPTEEELSQCEAFVRQSAHGGEAQRSDLAALQARAKQLHDEIEAALEPMRKKMSPGGPRPQLNAPEPYAEWDFESGPGETKGRLPLKLSGNARIENGALMLDGSAGSFARSQPLPQTLRAKTLEAWVKLDRLDQRGGGVMTVQDASGGVFDSIVFAEKESRCWVPGSNNFKRSQVLAGPEEAEATLRPVHVAVSYAADGTVTAYRDGLPYGKSYKSSGPAEFGAGEAAVQFGCRHGNGGGNKLLFGQIHRARLYDRALSAGEILLTRQLEQSGTSEREIIAALDPSIRAEVQAKKREIAAVQEKAQTLNEQIAGLGGPEQAWASLALSLFNTKEFIYLK